MASRYGRKKRRHDRALIENLELAVKSAEDHARVSNERAHLSSARLSEFERRLMDWNEDTTFLLGKYSAFLSKAGQVKVQRLLGELMPRSKMTVEPFGDHSMASMQVRTIILRTFHTLCEEDLTRLSFLIRMWQVEEKTGRKIYTVSEDLDSIVTLTARDKRELATHLAERMVEYWFGGKGCS